MQNQTVDHLEDALQHNLAFQDSLRSNLDRLKKILMDNTEKQVMGYSLISI